MKRRVFILAALMAGSCANAAWAQECATGVAFPIRHLTSESERCPGNGDPKIGKDKTIAAQTVAERELSERLNRELFAFKLNNVTLGFAKAGLDLGGSLPVVKQLSDTPIWGGVAQIARRHAEDYFKDSIDASLDTSIKRIFADFLLRNPTELEAEQGAAMQRFVGYLGKKLTWERYGEVGKALDQHLLREVEGLNTQLSSLREEVRAHRAAMTPGAPNVAMVVDGAPIDLEASFSEIRGQFNNALSTAATQTVRDVEILHAYQKQAVAHHAALVVQVNEVRAEVDAQAEQIAKNTAKIDQQGASIAALSATMLDFSVEQEQTAVLAADNALRIDALSAVLFDNVDAKSQLALIQSKAIQLDENQRTKIETALKAKVAQQEQIDTLNKMSRGIEMGQQALQIGVRAGLSPQDAERGAKLLAVAEVGIGIARIYAGDMSGILSVANGAGTLFGKSGEPDPAHAQIMQQFAVVNAKLDALKIQVAGVSKQIDALATWSVKSHETVMYQLSVIEGLGRSTNYKIDYLTRTAQTSSTPECRALGGRNGDDYLFAVGDATTVATLRRLNELNTAAPDMGRCLRSYENAPSPLDLPFGHNDDGDALSEGYPKLIARSYVTGSVARIDQIAECRGAVLINPVALLKLGRARAEMDSLLYLTTNSGIQSAAFFNAQEHSRLHRTAIASISRWERAIDCAIAQQSLMAGGAVFGEPLLNVFQNALAGPSTLWPEQVRFSRQVMKQNLPYIRLNLATRILFTEFSNNAPALNLLAKIEAVCASTTPASPEDLAALNAFIRNQRFTIIAPNKPLAQGCTLALRLIGSPLSAGEPVFEELLNIAPASIVGSNRMLYPDEIDGLIAVKANLARLNAEYVLSEKLSGDIDAQAFINSNLSN